MLKELPNNRMHKDTRKLVPVMRGVKFQSVKMEWPTFQVVNESGAGVGPR